MDRQNQRTIRKNQGDKVKGINQKHIPINKKRPKEQKNTFTKIESPTASNNSEDREIQPDEYSFGQKVKIVKNITSVDGMLHKNDIVKIDGHGGMSDLRVVDSLGRAWYVNLSDIKSIDEK